MSRPGFVVEVDERTPALLTFSGDRVWLDRRSPGTNVVFAAEPTPSSDPAPLIDAAIAAPAAGEPLSARLRPQTKLTLVVLDHERSRPQMRFDIRRTIVERVLEQAARAGVDDVEILIAGGLNKRWNPVDITRILGDRVATSFQPDGLIGSHDVTSDALVSVGEVDGHEVRVPPRLVDSDLIVTIGVQAQHTPVTELDCGLFDVETHRRLGAPDADPAFAAQVLALLRATFQCYALQAVVGQPHLSGALRHLSVREWEWGYPERLAYLASRQAAGVLPRTVGRALYASPVADYTVLDVVGGSGEEAYREAAEVWCAANAVAVEGGADIVVTGVWAGSFDDGDPVGSPMNAAHEALVRRIGSTLGGSFARPDGVAIAMHPLRPVFSNRRQSSASDFFAKVLPQTTDPAEMGGFEEAACHDPWYTELYRKQFADHPLRTFQVWYRVFRARAAFHDVIWVGGNRRTADLFGHRAATTYADALEIASDHVGRHPTITSLHGPGLPLGDVR